MQAPGRRTILTVSCIGMLTVCFATAAPAMCLTAIARELGRTKLAMGLFLSSAFWGFVPAILATGPLADRIGFRALLVFGALLQAAGLAGVSLAGSLPWLLAGGALVGAGTGVTDALLTPIVCAVYPERRSAITALLHGFYPVGVAATVGLILLLTGLGASWRGVYRVLAVLPLPYAVGMAAIGLPRQAHAGTARLPARRLLRRGAFLGLLAAIFLGAVTEITPTGWLPAFVEEATHGSPTAGGLGLLLFAAAMMLGRFGASAAQRRFGTRAVFAASAAICAASLLAAAVPAPTAVTIVALSVLGLGVAVFWPMICGAAGDRYPQAGASMFSLVAAAGNFGGVVGPAVMGAVAEWAGLRVAMGILAVAPIAVGLLMVRLAPPKPGRPAVTE